MKFIYEHGITSAVFRVLILDSSSSTGDGKTGLTHSSSGMIISTIADNEATATVYSVASSNVETITTLGTYANPSTNKCRFKEVDSINHPGIYEVQFANSRLAVANARSILVSITGATSAAPCHFEIQLKAVPSNVEKWDDVDAASAIVNSNMVQLYGGNVDYEVGVGLEPNLLRCHVTRIEDDVITENTLATGAINEIADGILTRDWSSITGEANRSTINALRHIRNKWSISGTTKTVYKEDGSTPAYTTTITVDNSGNITGDTP